VSGRVTSGGYGYTVGRSIAYSYLAIDDAQPGTPVAVDLFGELAPGVVVAEPVLGASS
jgi:4-methylaminobutanoate oxidase (formaldehyde-forming)